MSDWMPQFSPWRHGGWYVDNVRYPSGAVGCVSRNYPDGKWRIVCDPRRGAHDLHTYRTRDEAARAEKALVDAMASEPEADVVAEHLGIRVTICRSAGKDGAPVVFVDTDGVEEGPEGPLIRIRLNDEPVYVGEPYVPAEEVTE